MLRRKWCGVGKNWRQFNLNEEEIFSSITFLSDLNNYEVRYYTLWAYLENAFILSFRWIINMESMKCIFCKCSMMISWWNDNVDFKLWIFNGICFLEYWWFNGCFMNMIFHLFSFIINLSILNIWLKIGQIYISN